MPSAGSAPSSADAPGCVIAFSSVPTGTSAPALSVDTEGGLSSNPQFCGPGGVQTSSLLGYQDSKLGARPADYRRWLLVCKDGTRWPIEQYVADNVPGYVLYSSHADAAVHARLTDIAKTAQLPSITASLRLSDFGIVRGGTTSADGVHIQLDRVVQGVGQIINNNPTTYSYVIPRSLISSTLPVQPGELVEISTNGTTVTRFSVRHL